MPSLDDHFQALSTVRPPQTWPELGDRPPGLRTRPTAPLGRRLGVAALALAVAAGGLVLAVRAFRTDGPSPRPASTAENGVIAFSRGGREAGLYVMNPDGSGVRPLTTKAVDTDVAWSPDGSRIAFVRGFADEDAGIYVIRADGADVRRVTDGGSLVDGSDVGPAWSPDGTRIAFAREGRQEGAETGNADIYVVDADGSNLVRPTEGPVMEYEPAWSPDGTRIAYEGYDLASGGQPPSPVRLYVMNSDGTGITELGPENVQGPAWSPDGSEIAYVDTATGSIMAIRPDGTGPRRILDVAGLVGGVPLVYDVAWSPDGTKLAFMAGPDSEDTHIYLVNRDGSNAIQLTHAPAPDSSPAWQPIPMDEDDRTREVQAVVSETVRFPAGSAYQWGLATGHGSVWLQTGRARTEGPDACGGNLLRFDADTGEQVASIDLEAITRWETGGGGTALSDDVVWVLGTACPGGSGDSVLLQRVDPVANALVEVLELGPGHAVDVAAGDSGVWLLLTRPADEGRSVELAQLDPATKQVLRGIRLDFPGSPNRVFIGEGAVWVVASRNDGSGSGLVKVDPETGEVVATLDALVHGAGIGELGLWAAMECALVRIDPVAVRVIDERPEAGCVVDPSQLDVGLGGVWYLRAHEEAPRRPRLVRYNPFTGEVDVTVDLGEGVSPIDMTLTDGGLWVLGHEGSLTKVGLQH
ncbi:MAG: hypothetical protein ACRDKA_06100 [Actinomycetota bacterium]